MAGRGPSLPPASTRRLVIAIAIALAPACGASLPGPAAPACPGDGVVILARQTQVAELARCATARGVTVRSGAALDLSALRALTTVTGDLVIGPTVAIEEIELGELRVVGGALRVVGNGLLQGLYLPRLERAGRIEIEGNPAVTTIALPRLAVVHGAVRIADDANLAVVELSALASIEQELVIAGDPSLSLVELGRLERAGAVRIDAPKLPADVVDPLRAAAAHR